MTAAVDRAPTKSERLRVLLLSVPGGLTLAGSFTLIASCAPADGADIHFFPLEVRSGYESVINYELILWSATDSSSKRQSPGR